MEVKNIAIGRALLQEKDILILGEATTSLDKETEEKIIDNIHMLFKNLTIIHITHNHKIFQNRRVIKIDKQKIIEKK